MITGCHRQLEEKDEGADLGNKQGKKVDGKKEKIDRK
jgi:hypothetical protein